MAETLATGSALYYPYIHVRSLDHVKAALLYWDRVRRIVPDMMRDAQNRNCAFDDSPDARLLAERGLLVCTDPVPYENQAADTFFEHISPQAANFRIDLDAGRELARNKRGIHIEKIGMEFLWRLQHMGLAQKFGDWVSMHDEVGAFYMFCLAAEMGQKINAALLGDSSEDAVLGESLLFEPSSPAEVSEHLRDAGGADERLGLRVQTLQCAGSVRGFGEAGIAGKDAPGHWRGRGAERRGSSPASVVGYFLCVDPCGTIEPARTETVCRPARHRDAGRLGRRKGADQPDQVAHALLGQRPTPARSTRTGARLRQRRFGGYRY
jgi:hypothetical protein